MQALRQGAQGKMEVGRVDMKEVLKQEKGDSNCTGVTAAMAFNCSIPEVKEFMGHEPPYSTIEFVQFAMSKGYSVGIGAGDKEGLKLENDTDNLVIEIPVKGQPAFVVVNSFYFPGKTHAIYWDGDKVYDPCPCVKDHLPLSSYEVRMFMPIIDQGDDRFSH